MSHVRTRSRHQFLLLYDTLLLDLNELLLELDLDLLFGLGTRTRPILGGMRVTLCTLLLLFFFGVQKM